MNTLLKLHVGADLERGEHLFAFCPYSVSSGSPLEERRPGMPLPLSDFWCTSLMLQNGHAATPPATAVTD